jgi:hypothetical protein
MSVRSKAILVKMIFKPLTYQRLSKMMLFIISHKPLNHPASTYEDACCNRPHWASLGQSRRWLNFRRINQTKHWSQLPPLIANVKLSTKSLNVHRPSSSASQVCRGTTRSLTMTRTSSSSVPLQLIFSK